MYEVQVTTAGSLLLAIQEVEDFLNLDPDNPPPELVSLMKAVQEKAEAYTARSFTQKTIQLKIDGIPTDGVLRLPRGPVTSITSVKTLDEADAETVIAASTYYLADNERLVFTTHPNLERLYGGLMVTYVAGSSTQGLAPPDSIKAGMLKALSTIFENREDYMLGASVVRLPDESITFFNTWRAIC